MNIQLPESDGIGKAFAAVQLVVFLAMFIGLYVFVRQYVGSFILRVLCFIGVYIVCSLISFCVLKPLADKAANALRNRKK